LKLDVEEQVMSILDSPIKEMGYNILCIKQETFGSKNMQIMAERIKDQNLDINDCVKISKFASVLLENDESINFDFGLEVSSPGIDRPLIQLKDYTNFKGSEVKIILNKEINDKKKLSGLILDVKENSIIEIKLNDERLLIPFDFIKECRLIPQI
jgi:ribosome maturation factor RimP